MILKRLYLRGKAYDYYFHPEIKTYHEFMEFAMANPNIDCENLDNANYVISDLSHEEQNTYWKQSIGLIMRDTRWVLNNLEFTHEYKVRWNNYSLARKGHGCPPKTVTEECDKLYNVL